MANTVLPEILRNDIKELLKKGYTQPAVFMFVKAAANAFIDSDAQLKKCIAQLEAAVSTFIPRKRINYPLIPKPGYFDKKKYSDVINPLNKRTPLKRIEKAGVEVARDILETLEGFKNLEPGPTHAGTPFDLFGYKGRKPYIIELKASLGSFNYPGEIQKQRMQNLLGNVKKLHIALFQVKLKEGEYRIFYDNQMDLLFYAKKMPLGEIEKWIKKRIE
jgi:hypothetical protein